MTSSYVIVMSGAEKECNRFQNRTMAINCIRHQINTEMILFALVWKWSQRIVLIHRSISIVMYCTQHMWSRVLVLGNNIISTSAIKRIIQSIGYISSANLHLISNCRIFLPWLMVRTTRSVGAPRLRFVTNCIEEVDVPCQPIDPVINIYREQYTAHNYLSVGKKRVGQCDLSNKYTYGWTHTCSCRLLGTVEWRLDGIQRNRWLHKARDMQLQVTSVGKIIHEVEMHLYCET